jgi:hypothetical protein
VRENWAIQIDPIDSPPVGNAALDVDAAVTTALEMRADLQRVRKDIVNADTAVKYAGNQRLPDVRFNASYQASGLGGTQVNRTGGFPGTIIGPGDGDQLRVGAGQLFAHDYPTWAAGVSVTYPIGGGAEQANYARTEAGTRAERRAPEERGGEGDSADSRRRLEDRDERQTDRDDARGARAGRAAARRGAQALRGRDVDELPRDSGPARHGAGEDQRAGGPCSHTTCRSSTTKRCSRRGLPGRARRVQAVRRVREPRVPAR